MKLAFFFQSLTHFKNKNGATKIVINNILSIYEVRATISKKICFFGAPILSLWPLKHGRNLKKDENGTFSEGNIGRWIHSDFHHIGLNST